MCLCDCTRAAASKINQRTNPSRGVCTLIHEHRHTQHYNRCTARDRSAYWMEHLHHSPTIQRSLSSTSLPDRSSNRFACLCRLFRFDDSLFTCGDHGRLALAGVALQVGEPSQRNCNADHVNRRDDGEAGFQLGLGISEPFI